MNRFETFSLAIFDISRCWHKIAAEELGRFGLRSAHAIYLTTLLRYPEGVTAPKLGELCGRDKADVSRMTAILEEHGMLAKEGGHQNQYRGSWKLTDRGLEVAREIRKRAELAVELAGGELSEEERSSFYQVLERIAGNLRRISREGLQDPARSVEGNEERWQ